MAASSPYAGMILAAARRYNVDPRLIYAILQRESSMGQDSGPSLPHDPDSPIGIAQMRPSTIKGLLGPNANPNDPETAINGAAAYLDDGMKKAEAAGYKNPGAFAVAHYFAGPDLKQWGPKTTDYVRGVATNLGLDLGKPVASGGAAPPIGNLNIGVSPEVAPTLKGVDPKLVDIVDQASSYLPKGWRAEIVSGYRLPNPGNLGLASLHPWGHALDVQLYDANGKPVSNYQSGANFRTYEQFAQNARKVQGLLYPELDDQFHWGGYFYNKGSGYGANDLMHFSTGNERGEAGTWEGGLNPQGKAAGFDRGGAPSVGMGNVADFRLGMPGETMVAGAPGPQRPIQLASAGVSDIPVMGGSPPPAPGRLPEDWADVPGAPASMRYAPPSMYTAGSPEQQTQWEQASTPAGYSALAALASAPPPAAPVAAGPAPTPAVNPPPEAPQPLPASWAEPPTTAGPGNIMSPAGGSQGWAGYQGLPGAPSGPTPLPADLANIAGPGPGPGPTGLQGPNPTYEDPVQRWLTILSQGL